MSSKYPDPPYPNLQQYLIAAARKRPDAVAVEDSAGLVRQVTYEELDALSDALRDRLHHLGVRRGDRVGICLPKSIDAVIAIFGILKCGAAHVPVDAGAPPARNALILNDCSVRAVVVDASVEEALQAEWGGRPEVPGTAPDREAAEVAFLSLSPSERSFEDTLRGLQRSDPAPPIVTVASTPDELAYILYTSGSTGKPKGVMISHRNAMSFVDWCSQTFEPLPEDRFSSHAPFHFDLSVLDIYVPIKHGATLVLIGEQPGKDPVTLAELISRGRITSWYSTPSILSLLTQFGHMERHDYSALRIVHFAGEVFPVKHLRALKTILPAPRYFNLYGPTETNVCTYFEVPREVPEDRTEPYPIGLPCSHALHRVVDSDGVDVPPGEEGELWIGGPGVMQGYWNAPEMSAAVFRTDEAGETWYRTGDLVVQPPDGNLLFRGRRDRMVKKRGYRIELGEIEAALYRHPEIKEAAVVAMPDAESGVRIRAFLSFRAEKPSIIRLKQFCAEHLLAYMIPDQFTVLDVLPKTSTDKTDYQSLKQMV